MTNSIFTGLTPVRRRQRWRVALWSFFGGVWATAVVVMLIALILRFSAPAGWIAAGSPWLSGVGVPIIGGLAAAVAAALRSRPWRDAARAVDERYLLKDRVVTALQFSQQPEVSDLQRLQIRDALRHLDDVDASLVVPIGLPRWAWRAPASVAVAVTLLLLPTREQRAAETAFAKVDTSAVAERLAADLDELKAAAEESGLDEFERVVSQLQKRTKQLRDSEPDLPTALATMSETQQELAKQLKELSITATDTQLKSLGEALETAEEFQPAAESLKQGNFDTAAQQLESVDAQKLSTREAKAAAEKLAEVARAMKDAGMQKLSDKTSEMSDAVRQQQSDAVRRSAEEIAKDVRQHAARREMAEMLQAQSMKLAESKQEMRMGAAKVAGESQRGSETKTVAKGQTDQKSQNSSSSTGGKTAGNIDGEKTQLESQRQMARLTGLLGDAGDSQFETETGELTPQEAQRQAGEVYGEYSKMSDTVLNSEALPLGYRQTIRRYFESIRPSADVPD